jgi:hypothetical protein
MALDASIYQNLKPIQIDMPSPIDSAQRAMSLSALAMKNQHMGQEAEKMQAETLAAKMKAQHDILSITQPAMEHLAGMAEPDRAQAYSSVMKQLEQQGVPMQNVPKDASGNYLYDPGHFKRSYEIGHQTKEALDNQLLQKQIAKTAADTDKTEKEKVKGLASEQSDKMAGFQSSRAMLGDLRKAIEVNEDAFGPVSGRLASWNPYNKQGQQLGALFGKASQILGKALEGGKLTDQDRIYYMGLLPKQSDTKQVALDKVDQLERMLADQENSSINTYAKAGLNVSNFKNVASKDIGILNPKSQSAGGRNTALAVERPNFDSMSVEELQKYVKGK